MPLLPVTAAFFTGRLVSYSLYLGAAGIAQASFGDQLRAGLTSWPSIALQVALLVGVVLLGRVDWASRLPGHAPHATAGP